MKETMKRVLKAVPAVKYVGIDSWNRPVFKSDDKRFYGCVDQLFSYSVTKKEVLKSVKASDLVYFGTSFDCEPNGFSCDVEIDGGRLSKPSRNDLKDILDEVFVDKKGTVYDT